MDGEALLDRIRAETDTELSRLGSEKLLLAATDATLEAEAIAGAILTELATGRERLEAWAEAAADDEHGLALAEAASQLADLEAAVAEDWPTAAADDDGLLGDLEAPGSDRGRAGAGLLGVPLVLDRLLLQAVSFHVNEANPTAADRFRERRDDVRGIRDEGAAELARALAGSDDADEVVADAVDVVEAAYATYAARLEAMGLDPKPIC